MDHDSEYRCPNCLKQGGTGLNLALYVAGVPMKWGAPIIELTPPYWIVCLTCYTLDVPGVRGERGMVMEVAEYGRVNALGPDGAWWPDKPKT